MKYQIFGISVVLGLLSVDASAASDTEFSQQEVVVRNHSDGINLAGTLTMPESGRPAAAIVMATGSGPQNRDEEVFGHKPFKVIAEYLSSHGYAVLRMDDRGIGGSEGSRQQAVSDDFARDTAAGLAWLDSCFAGVPKGVIGHSEGGILALKNADNSDFIITLAGPAWSGDSIVMSQSRASAVGMTGRWDGEELQRSLMSTTKSRMPDFQARIVLTSLLEKAYGEFAGMDAYKKQINAQVEVLLSPWYRNFLRYDPAEDIAKINIPWLALNGSKDTQVLPENLRTIAELNPRATTIELPGLNHLFQTAVTGLPTEYASIGEDFSPVALEAILNWLNKNFAN